MSKMVLKSKAALKSQEPAKAEEAQPSTTKRTSTKSKSPARSRSPARPKSPARSKSPGRPKSPSRAKRDVDSPPPPLKSSTPKVSGPTARSPIRKSPSRKSPTRVVKTVTKSAETLLSERVQRPRRARPEIDYSDLDNQDFGSDVDVVFNEKPQAAVRGRARRLEVQIEKLSQPLESTGFNLIKRTSNSSREFERVVHLRNFDTVAAKLGEFSDEEEKVLRKSASSERGGNFKQLTEFGGPWGALFFIIALPVTAIVFYVTCNENQCSFVKLPNYSKYLALSTYVDLKSIFGVFIYTTLLATLSVIPFGGKKITGLPTKQGKFEYNMNGFFCFCILATILIGLELRNIHVSDFINKHLFHILIGTILFGLLQSIYAYIRSFYVPFSALNAHVLGRNRLYAFFLGRELCPRLFGLVDLKMYAVRIAAVSAVLLDFAILYANLEWTDEKQFLKVNPTLITLVLIRAIYLLDSLLYEHVWVSSFEVQYEGFGYMSGMGYPIYPFLTAILTKYVVDYNINLATWKLIFTTIVFLVGFLIYRGSNNQKDAFRKNPYDPALSHLDTIPTTKGKKLICSGFWGIVRHPNYLGDILIQLSFIAFGHNVPPVIIAISLCVLLIHRSVRDNIRCKQKYGAAWDRYCHKVKYVLLPKVY